MNIYGIDVCEVPIISFEFRKKNYYIEQSKVGDSSYYSDKCINCGSGAKILKPDNIYIEFMVDEDDNYVEESIVNEVNNDEKAQEYLAKVFWEEVYKEEILCDKCQKEKDEISRKITERRKYEESLDFDEEQQHRHIK
ncbi:MAG: hypothetical protein ACE5F2_01940 [Candidatus Paceibacteria bacterium]